jgi:hypothetical protein
MYRTTEGDFARLALSAEDGDRGAAAPLAHPAPQFWTPKPLVLRTRAHVRERAS